RATDAAGNADSSPASFTWTVDTQAPDTLIDSAPLAITNSNTATFTFGGSDSSGDTFECSLNSLNGGAFTACTSPQTYNGLADGSYTFMVRATDPAGNTDPSPEAFSWVIDSVAPDTSITAGPADGSTTTDTSAT